MSDDTPPEMSQKHMKESKLQLECSRIREPSEILKKILDDRTDSKLLYHAIRRHVFFLVQRGVKYEDGEITFYDKILMKHFNDGLPMKNIGLLELFIDNYAAIRDKNSAVDKETAVCAFLTAQKIIDNAGRSPVNGEPRKAVSSHLGGCSTTLADQSVKPFKTDDRETKNKVVLNNLIQVYHAAKADYYIADANKTGISDKSTDKFSNVRFLRDTAENLLRCLKAETGDHPLVPEVERVVNASCAHAERLAGGRKRIFEDPEDEQIIRHRSSHRSHHGSNSGNSQANHPGNYPKRPRHSQPVDHYRGEAHRSDYRADHYRPDGPDRPGRYGRSNHYDRANRPDRRERTRHEPIKRALSMERIGDTR
ncbi:uncharacterized protein N7498_008397 [Penicillium cinerascens]|uniref:Uncharacterized protein n=1 Tax=Penicillium cinerascens TaxID=70096 RepID=A0A9W9JEM6_9EURO|nr:uncharacterized protein N7498_008397 [Penicillium cinerascens]KAJ5194959.1 hypothetical protein N7498_008397 [Penicillium cinerascens]